MNKKNIFYAALLLMAIGAEAKEIKGKVMADGKGLAKVVVTDGTAFALTSEDGSYMIDADEKSHFIYVVTPSGYMACLLYTSPSPRDRQKSRMPSSA